MRGRLIFAAMITAILLLASAAAAQAATINVTTTADTGTGSGDCLSTDMSCSLRQAVAAEDGTANGGDSIVLGSLTYNLTQGTDLDITEPVTLSGSGSGTTTINGQSNTARILRVDGVAVTIDGLTVDEGIDGADESCIDGESPLYCTGGGDLYNNGGSVTLEDVAFTNSAASATPFGGAISNGSGSLNMTDVQFSGDSAGSAGALFVRSGTVTGNDISFNNDSTTCCDAGAMYLYTGSATFTNTTVTGSYGLDGTSAFVNHDGTLTLKSDTFSGDGEDIKTDQGGGTTSVENTILGRGGERPGCTAPGQDDELSGGTSGDAITNDLGHNIDEDGGCGLTGTGDISNQDPNLLPVTAANGGDVPTQALLAGSPALDAGDDADCPPTDARGVPRPQGSHCDIGAFEAKRFGDPTTATTGAATGVTDTTATLGATVNLDGEAGGLHFNYGTSPGNLTPFPDGPVGVVASDTSVTETLTEFSPGTTYYYQAYADNASGSLGASNVGNFTTAPSIFDVSSETPTDTTETIDFSVDPGSVDATYYIEYGLDTSYGLQSATMNLAATSGPTAEHITLTGLDPQTPYHFDVIGQNSGGGTGQSDDQQFTTAGQITGNAGSPVTLNDNQIAGPSQDYCPLTANVTWGDGTTTDSAPLSCYQAEPSYWAYDLNVQHTYAASGGYPIAINYNNGLTGNYYAEIAGAAPAPTNTVAPAISGTPNVGQTLSCSQGTWTGSGDTYAYLWNRDGSALPGQTNSTYVVQPADAGHTFTCTVTATDAGGSTRATSASVNVPPNAASPPAPEVSALPTQLQGATTAKLTGGVDPEGLATKVYFVYGLDGRYQPSGTTQYDVTTAVQQLGSGSSTQTVTAPVSGLVPNALYHVRLVAISSAGTTTGPDSTFQTPSLPAPPVPVLGHKQNLAPVSGRVFVLEHGRLVPLTESTQLPSGTVIDALRGTVDVVSAAGAKGRRYTGTFGGAVIEISQTASGPNKGLSTVSIVEGAHFQGAPSYAACQAKGSSDRAATAHAALSKRILETLHSKSSGRFRSRGRYASATVLGTQWTTSDRCDGTLISVQVHSVLVSDLVKHITVVVRAGHHYLALAHKQK